MRTDGGLESASSAADPPGSWDGGANPEVARAQTDKAWKVGRSLWSVREFHKQLLAAAGIKG